MADQYGRDSTPLAGAGAAPAGASDIEARLHELGNQYPGMGTDIQMLMQGAANDATGTGTPPNVVGPPGIEQALQAAIARATQPDDLNMFQRVLQNASVMPGLTGTPEGAGILSLLLGVTGTPLGSRALGQGAELQGLGRILSGYAALGKMQAAQRQGASDDAFRQFVMGGVQGARNEGQTFGAYDLPLGTTLTNPRVGATITAPTLQPETVEGLELDRRYKRLRAGTAGAPAGAVVQGTGPSPIYDAGAVGAARAQGQPLPQPIGMEGADPLQAVGDPLNMAIRMGIGRAHDKAAATSEGTSTGQGNAQITGTERLPNPVAATLSQMDSITPMLDKFEKYYLGGVSRSGLTQPPLVPGVEVPEGEAGVLSAGRVLLQSVENRKLLYGGDTGVNTAEGLRNTLSERFQRAYSQSVGTQTELDIKRVMASLPNMDQPLNVRRQKLAELRDLLTEYRRSLLAPYGRIPGVKGGGYGNPTARKGTVEQVGD